MRTRSKYYASPAKSPTEHKKTKKSELHLENVKFRRACEQIVQLNKQLHELQARYKSAKKENIKSFRYHLRLRLAVVEGIRNMYYEYAHVKAADIARLRRIQLPRDRSGETLSSDSGVSDSDHSDSTE